MPEQELAQLLAVVVVAAATTAWRRCSRPGEHQLRGSPALLLLQLLLSEEAALEDKGGECGQELDELSPTRGLKQATKKNVKNRPYKAALQDEGGKEWPGTGRTSGDREAETQK